MMWICIDTSIQFFLVGDVAFVDIIEDSHGKSKVQKQGESFNLFLICIPVVET